MSGELRHDQIEVLLGAYALDAVDGEERDLVEGHLAACARCRSEIRDHREVASLLAHSGGSAPDGLWDRIAGALDTPPPALSLVSSRPVPAGTSRGHLRRSWGTRVVAAVIVAAAAVIAVLAVQVDGQDERIDQLSALLSTDGVSRAFQSALGEPDARLVQLVSADGGLKLKAVVTEEGDGYVSASSLPRLPDGRTYQLWGDLGDRRVSLGPVGPTPGVVVFQTLEGVRGLAVTDELAPGVVVSDQPALVYGILPG